MAAGLTVRIAVMRVRRFGENEVRREGPSTPANKQARDELCLKFSSIADRGTTCDGSPEILNMVTVRCISVTFLGGAMKHSAYREIDDVATQLVTVGYCSFPTRIHGSR